MDTYTFQHNYIKYHVLVRKGYNINLGDPRVKNDFKDFSIKLTEQAEKAECLNTVKEICGKVTMYENEEMDYAFYNTEDKVLIIL